MKYIRHFCNFYVFIIFAIPPYFLHPKNEIIHRFDLSTLQFPTLYLKKVPKFIHPPLKRFNYCLKNLFEKILNQDDFIGAKKQLDYINYLYEN